MWLSTPTKNKLDIFLKLWIGAATNFHAWPILLAFIPKENKKQTNLYTVHFTDSPFAVAFPIQAETGYPGQKQDSLYTATYWSMSSHVRFQLMTYSLALEGSLSGGVFEGRTSTWSGYFASLGSSVVETLGYIVFIREKKLRNTNLLASWHIERYKASLPVEVLRS